MLQWSNHIKFNSGGKYVQLNSKETPNKTIQSTAGKKHKRTYHLHNHILNRHPRTTPEMLNELLGLGSQPIIN